jgi:hypothetical protein
MNRNFITTQIAEATRLIAEYSTATSFEVIATSDDGLPVNGYRIRACPPARSARSWSAC